jgi:hypothetical protein
MMQLSLLTAALLAGVVAGRAYSDVYAAVRLLPQQAIQIGLLA